MKTGSPNSASSNTGEGCPLNCAQSAPRDMLRDALAGRLHLQLLSRRDLGLIVVKLVEHVKTLEQCEKRKGRANS